MSRASTAGAGAPRVIALGSGHGGVGRTTLALELARVLARRNVRTLVVDCALSAPAVGPALGRSAVVGTPVSELLTQATHMDDFVAREGSDALSLLTLSRTVEDLGELGRDDALRFAERLRRLEQDLVLLDLPAGPLPFWLDLMALADVPIVVTGPEGWSVRTIVPFLRVLRRRARSLGVERRCRTYLLLNGCRDASERELGEVLCHALWRLLGHYPRYLGPVDYDDRRWFHLRHGESTPPLSGMAGLGVQVEEVVKRILSLDDFDQSRPRHEDQDATGATWMGMAATASASDLRAQYRRLWEGYRRESAVSQVLFAAEERASILDELERTYRALQTALEDRRVPTPPAIVPLTTGPGPAGGAGRDVEPAGGGGAGAAEGAARGVAARGVAAREGAPPDAAEGQSAPVQASALDEAETCGDLLARRREAESLTLRELSLRTRIGLRYLEAIEAMEVDALPPPVYLRGYLREIARALGLSADPLLERYLVELAEERGREHSGMGA